MYSDVKIKRKACRNFRDLCHLADLAFSEDKLNKAFKRRCDGRCPFEEANSKLQTIFILGKQTPKSVEEDINMYSKIPAKLTEKTKIWRDSNAKVNKNNKFLISSIVLNLFYEFLKGMAIVTVLTSV